MMAALEDVAKEWRRAKDKHGEMTMDGTAITDLVRLAALAEEFGEASAHLTYDKDRKGLRKELIQVANVALTWASVLDE